MSDTMGISGAGNETGLGGEGYETAGWQGYSGEGLTEEEGSPFFDKGILADGGEDAGQAPGDDGAEHMRPRAADRQGDAVIEALEERMNNFEEDSPDFEDALVYLAQRRSRELIAYAAVEPRLRDDGVRARQMEIELGQIVAAALHRGEHPAEAVYAFARGYGFDAGKVAGRAGKMTLKKLAAMREQDFGRWYENNGETFRKLMGG
ncbi:MAG: Hypothetical protein BHV28_00800 [Candidatus Tokpelaia hoelldobleri]|uniref:Uncharacterized protein n=1 Tax=Candidatus Tokpelaia hoelldobleri TaxID=1902579 RepID=A0A1U9JSG5_9HYPH|nr:MAG: Hypothetical protein BHV28_00800 [Candidatus Tokpelaia hoelldoblerii]